MNLYLAKLIFQNLSYAITFVHKLSWWQHFQVLQDLFVRVHPVLPKNKYAIPYIFIDSTEEGDIA